MRASVIVRSRNEAGRLRLTLASLAAQTEQAEIVVVDDGSTDDTAAVVAEAAQTMPLSCVHHAQAAGRSASANAGAAQASGQILIFLDGDTLAAPGFVAAHLARHRNSSDLVARGETYHLRQTRPFLDPESGSPFSDQVERVQAMSERERALARVSRDDVGTNFPSIEARSQPGIYPGAGPRQLYAIEMEALRNHPDCPALWAAASGSNQSVPRRAFLDVGGFDPDLTINEHRELALRLCAAGLRMAAAEGARTHHMIHRSGWRDPLVERQWEERFFAAHPLGEVALLSVLWGSLSSTVSTAARIESIPALVAAARRCRGIAGGPDAVRAAHFAAASRAMALA